MDDAARRVVCDHGQLRRQCEICELTAALREVETELEAERQLRRVHDACRESAEKELDALTASLARVEAAARRLLNELPDWSLERMRDGGIGNSNVACIRQRRDELAASLLALTGALIDTRRTDG